MIVNPAQKIAVFQAKAKEVDAALQGLKEGTIGDEPFVDITYQDKPAGNHPEDTLTQAAVIWGDANVAAFGEFHPKGVTSEFKRLACFIQQLRQGRPTGVAQVDTAQTGLSIQA